jgi:hypothetical protein
MGEKMKKKYYDYSVGLNTPYWVQEWRSLRGELILRFDTPKKMAFFVATGCMLIVMVIINVQTPLFRFLHHITLGTSFVLWVIVPLRFGKFYCEYEPDGKLMHQYLVDVAVYCYCFVLNKKKIYNGVRVCHDEDEILVFEKVDLS